jgi:hypothetical protein
MKNYTFSVEIDDSGKVIMDSDGNIDGILILGFLELEKAKQLNSIIARSKEESTYEVVDEEKPVEGV